MRVYRLILIAFWSFFTLFLLLALLTFSPTDPSWLYETSQEIMPKNWGGNVGAYCAGILIYFFGGAAFIVLFLTALMAWGMAYGFKKNAITDRIIGCSLGLFFCASAFAFLNIDIFRLIIPGGFVGQKLLSLFNNFGTPITVACIFIGLLLSAILSIRLSWISYLSVLFQGFKRFKKKTEQQRRTVVQKTSEIQKESHDQRDESEINHDQTLFEYALPQKELFDHHQHKERAADDQRLKSLARTLEEKLEHFGIYGNVVDIKPGPVITLFTYQPRVDMKISAIVAREDDLALALKTMSLRIIAPIPGTAVIGFEVANDKRSVVKYSDCWSALEQPHGFLPVILGQDTSGDAISIDIVETPHLLIAGSTGSGKSVALHTLLISLLCQKTPEELKLILIDPKRLELNQFAGCPHLLFPIITQSGQAIQALHWAVSAMEERYETLAAAGVRTIQEFHMKHDAHGMPYIVIFIDELADLMMTGHKAVEELITRLAQMARAAGIHLIAATQRPSVDVVTGLIKVNFPSRIAFKVASKVDSRTILDVSGAEKLLGKGDMLFLTSQGRIQRLHGAHVSESEIARMVKFMCSQRSPQFVDLNTLRPVDTDDTEDAQLYPHIISFLDEVDEISISLLQRRFKIGYNRSARFIERLEHEGKVTPATGGKMRRVIKIT